MGQGPQRAGAAVRAPVAGGPAGLVPAFLAPASWPRGVITQCGLSGPGSESEAAWEMHG